MPHTNTIPGNDQRPIQPQSVDDTRSQQADSLFVSTEYHQTAYEVIEFLRQQMRRMLDLSSDAIILIGPRGFIRGINHGAEALLGLSVKSVVGHSAHQILSSVITNPSFLDNLLHADTLVDDDAYLQESSHVIPVRGPSGQLRHFKAQQRPYPTPEGIGTYLLLTDITDQEQAEETQKLLAVAVEQAAELLVIIARNGLVQYINPAYERLSEFTPAEVCGKPIQHLLHMEGQNSEYRRVWRRIRQGDQWSGILQCRSYSGGYYETRATFTPIKDGQGNITHFVGLMRDLSDTRSLERQLLQARKMEAIGTLASGIAHDFNNILSVIFGFTELARLYATENIELAGYLDEIAIASNRARDLVKQILTFTRQSNLERKPVQVSLIIKEGLKLLRASIPTTVRFQTEIDSDAIVSAAPTQIHQILMNLCTNAFHAMPDERGEMFVGLHEVEYKHIPADIRHSLFPGNYLRMQVRDDGAGMTPAVRERIFEPYFTTREKGEGTGMGLAIVLGIVKSYEGAVWVKSEPGVGSEFNVYLPVLELEEEEEPNIDLQPPIKATPAHVLFVDDEQSISRLHHKSLEQYGYRVTSLCSSLQALAAIQGAPDDFDVIVTDLTMPDMTGLELAREVWKLRPRLPVILYSGSTNRLEKAVQEEPGIARVLRKPLLSHELANAIETVLKEHERA